MTKKTLVAEYAALVRDTQVFIQSLKGVQKTQVHPKSEQTPAIQKDFSLKKKPKDQPLFSSNTNWVLQPMSQPFETPLRFSAYLKSKPLFIPLWLLLPKEDPTHRLFLENVSRTITHTFVPASVSVYDEKVWSDSSAKVILIPLSAIKKRYPQAEIHHPFKEAHLTILPLENLNQYQHGLNLKRNLWKAIVNMFQS